MCRAFDCQGASARDREPRGAVTLPQQRQRRPTARGLFASAADSRPLEPAVDCGRSGSKRSDSTIAPMLLLYKTILAPALLIQGARLRKTALRLPEAAGARSGTLGAGPRVVHQQPRHVTLLLP